DAGEAELLRLTRGSTTHNRRFVYGTVAARSGQRQIRCAHRVPPLRPAVLDMPGGAGVPCHTVDFSTGGMALRTDSPYPMAPATEVQVELGHRGRSYRLPAVVRQDRDEQGVSIEFQELDLEQERWLVASTFARADLWMS